MTDSLRPAADTLLHFLDDGGLLFSEDSQELYILNASAAFVWSCLENALERDEIVAIVERDYGVASPEAESQIDGLLLQWRALGLLAGTEQNRRLTQPRRGEEEEPTLAQWRSSAPLRWYSERFYKLLGTCFRLRYGTVAQESTVHPVLAHLESSAAEAAQVTAADLVREGEAHLLLLNGRRKERCALLSQLAPLVKWGLLAEAINSHAYLLYVHAGVVRSASGCLLLPAAPGSGKTSLTAALIHAGFTYLSDEVALLEEDTLQVLPVPVSLCIKDSAWDLLAPRHPGLHELAIHHRSDGKIVRYLNPPPAALDPEHERSYPVRWIVFPRYAPALRTELRPVQKADALHRLLKQCLAMPAPLDQRKVASIVRWISSIPCFEMPMSSLDDAVTLVNSLCRRPAAE
jgi:hypothetical protein